MKSLLRITALAVIVLTTGLTAASAQNPKPPVTKTPDYTIPLIKVNAFDAVQGELSDANPETGGPKSFFNALDTSLFVWVLISGEAGSFEAGRMAHVVVTEDKKIVATRNVQIGIPNEKGFYIVPVFVYGPLCKGVTITAKITGQKTASPKSVKIPFLCGE